MLAFMFLYVCWVSYFGKYITANTKFLLILWKIIFYSQALLIVIANNYVSITVIYSTFNDHGLSISNNRHQILALYNKNIVQYTRHQKKISQQLCSNIW